MPLSSYAVVTIDKHGSILSVNQSAVKLFGYAQNELLGKKINVLMPSPYAEQHDSFIKRYLETKEPHILRKSRVVPVLNKAGETFSLSLSVSEAETARGTLFIGVFERIQDNRVIIDTDQFGKIYSVKGNLFLTFGYRKEEILGKNISIICPQPIADAHDDYMKNYAEGKKERAVVGIIRNLSALRKGGELVNISLLVKNAILRIHAKDGTISETPGYRGTITPVDDIRAMATLTLNGRIQAASDNFNLLFGYQPGEMIGKHVVRLMKENPKDLFSSNISKGEKQIECVHRDKSIFNAKMTIHKALPTEGVDSKLKEEVLICKITRAAPKKKDKEIITEGESMGMYTYGKTLGSGYFGKVYMAYHRITGGRVAIKTLRKKQYLSVDMEYPPREIAVLKQLDHPYLNRLYDTIELPDRTHLILEFVDGEELCDIVEQERLTEVLARHYWRQILLGVSYLHTNGIVHRDLKLENIIIDKQNNAKIIDFGFGNFMLTKEHLLRTFCGSPDYAAPELFHGQAYNGYHVDCWSLGVVLFAMIFQALPFRNSQGVLSGKFEFPKGPGRVSAEVKDLITRILQPVGSKRLTVEEMLDHPWTNKGYAGPPEQLPSLFNETINKEILDKMTELGLDATTTTTSLRKQEYNQFTTTYFLLLREYQTKQETSSTTSSDASEDNEKEGKEKESKSETSNSEETIKRRRKRDECSLL